MDELYIILSLNDIHEFPLETKICVVFSKIIIQFDV